MNPPGAQVNRKGAVRMPTSMRDRGDVRSWAGWATLALVALLATGGAAARPGGLLLGLPPPALGVGLAGGVALLAAVAGTGHRLLGLALIPLALLAGLVLPGMGAVSGPPLLALALAGVVVVLADARWLPPRGLLFPVVLVLYLTVAARVQIQVGPQGDEPHYLMVADSLWRDHDVSLEKDYAEGRYWAFCDRILAPHYRVRGKHGEIYSLHALGLSLLILPAYALGGYPAASFFMALLAALLARELRELLLCLLEDRRLAEGGAWALALSPPLIHYAGLIFTEVPAALIVAVALRRLRRPRTLRPSGLVTVGALVAFLPWLNVRYAPIAGILILYGLSALPGVARAAALILPAIASAAASAAYHFLLYGFSDPRRVYGRRPELSLTTLPEGLPGLLLDQEFGLLVYAPLFALALPGFFLWWRKDRRQALTGAAVFGFVLSSSAMWHMWRGGWNPPARFLLPALPVLGLAATAALGRGLGAGGALLLGWSLWTGLTGGWQPHLVHRDRDGTAPLYRAASGSEEWTRLLPGYVLGEPDRQRLALVWGIALVAALPWRRPRVTAPRLALATVGLVGAAGVASSLSSARAGGREAVHLVGRPALSVPGWRLVRNAGAEWSPGDLGWGPLYEPHRYPVGAEIGSRLILPAGRYGLRLEGDGLGGEPPHIEIRSEGTHAAVRLSLLEKDEGGWWCRFEVREGETAVTLLLRGGGPLLLRSIRLQPQPLRPSTV